MVYIKQCNNTYIRHYNSIGYITNQLTRQDRIYDDIGALFLSKINRTPKLVSDIITEIHALFVDVSINNIKIDFLDFIEELERNSFLITGKSIEEIGEKDIEFTYNNYDLRDIVISNLKQQDTFTSSSDFLYSYFRDNPTIFGMHMEITSCCNEKCIHCYLTNQESAEDMNLELAINVLDQLKEMGTLSVTFSGGEPFLHKNFSEMLKHARKNDFIINILSNGTCIKDDHLSLLYELNISKLQISLYSMESDIHDSITQKHGSHRKTLETIEKVIQHNIPMQISCPIMKTNIDSYKEVALWCKTKGIRVLSDFILMARTDFDTSNLEQRLSINETSNLINSIIEVEDEYRSLLEIEMKPLSKEEYAKQPVCGVGVDNACITFDGTVYPCSGFQEMKLGSVLSDNLKEIWSNSEKIKFLRTINNSSFPVCIECKAKEYCAMCLVRNHNESGGNLFEINKHYCDVAFITKDLVENTP